MMRLSLFFYLFIIILSIAILKNFIPIQKALTSASSTKLLMDNSKDNSPLETISDTRSQQINVSTKSGLMQIRQQIDNLGEVQNKSLNTIKNQQVVLKNASDEASQIFLEAQQGAPAGGKIVLQLEALVVEMTGAQLILSDQGQNLIALNDQLSARRKLMAEEVNLANIDTAASLEGLQHRYEALKDQSSEYYNQVALHEQELRDRMERMHGKLYSMIHSYCDVHGQNVFMDRFRHVLEKEHEKMKELCDNQDKDRDRLMKAQENFVNFQELFKDKMRETEDTLENERQKWAEEQLAIEQRLADQKQKMEDNQAWASDQKQKIADQKQRLEDQRAWK